MHLKPLFFIFLVILCAALFLAGYFYLHQSQQKKEKSKTDYQTEKLMPVLRNQVNLYNELGLPVTFSVDTFLNFEVPYQQAKKAKAVNKLYITIVKDPTKLSYVLKDKDNKVNIAYGYLYDQDSLNLKIYAAPDNKQLLEQNLNYALLFSAYLSQHEDKSLDEQENIIRSIYYRQLKYQTFFNLNPL